MLAGGMLAWRGYIPLGAGNDLVGKWGGGGGRKSCLGGFGWSGNENENENEGFVGVGMACYVMIWGVLFFFFFP